jgi:YYY domain-containing protein
LREVVAWWFVLQLAGLAGIPACRLLLRSLPDRGYAFLKPLGLLSWGYLLWFGASLHVLRNNRLSIVFLWFVLAGAGWLLLRAQRVAVSAYLRQHWRYIVTVEVLFAVALGLAAFLRSYVPEIDGTEKPMDMAMLTGVLRSEYFPPQDPWLAGHTVSYYYGGYVLNGLVTSLTGLAPWVAFNVALAGVAALAAAAVFGVGWNLAALLGGGARRLLPYAAGLAAIAILLALGSAEGMLELLAAHGWGSVAFWEWWNIEDLRPGSTDEWYPTEFWFWWRATRTSPDTIVEFPFFSFLLGDLHPHVMALPFGITAAAIALSRLAAPIPTAGSRSIVEFVALAVFLGGLAWLNTWDLPTFGFLILAATAVRLSVDGELRWKRFALHSLALVGLAVLLYLPFYVTFRSQASGILPDRSDGTRPAIAALLWAALLLPAAAVFLRRGVRWRVLAPEWLFLPVAVIGAWSLFLFAWEGPSETRALMGNRGSGWLTALGYGVLTAAGFAALRAWSKHHASPTWVFGALATGTGALLLFGAELFYIRDVFDNRMNTVFKLSYQAWPLFVLGAIVGGLALVEHLQAGGAVTRLVAGSSLCLAGLLVAAGLSYSVGATFNRTDNFERERTLDGLAFTLRADPGEYALVEWLGTLDASTRIVEANGRDYTMSGRVAARSGLQGVIGWIGHELQWRGTESVYAGRYEDVEELYSTRNAGRALELLRKYAVDLVVVGNLERQRYPAPGLRKFERRFERVFESGDVVVYRVPEG